MLYLLTLTWNACDKLTALKNSLMPCLEDINYKWLIKDNASSDDTAEQVLTWGENVQLFKYKNNLQNFSQGMNFLFNETNAKDNDYVLLLNNDVIFNDNVSIKKMMSIMNNDDSVGVVGARLLFTGTDKLQHAGVVFNSAMEMPLHFRTDQKCDNSSVKNRIFQVVTGAVLLTKAKYFKGAFENTSGNKGMDENYHWAFDDVDLCLSIGVGQKKKIVYCGQTNIFHEESASLKKNPANKLFMKHNTLYFKNKWKGKYTNDQEVFTKNANHNLYKK